MRDFDLPSPLGQELMSATERAILDSAADDVPTVRARSRVLRAVGAAGALTTTAVSAGAETASTVATTAAIGKGASVAAAVTKTVLSIVVVGAVGAGVWQIRATDRPATPGPPAPVVAAASAAAVTSSAQLVSAPVASAPTATAEPAATPIAPTVSKPAARIPTASAALAPPVDSRPLEHEARMLAAVRAALVDGDRGAAQHALASYDQAFPSGQLRDEADVLRERLEGSNP